MRTFTLTMLFPVLLCCYSDVVSEKLPVLFLFTKANYAWGYTHAGILIDSSGVVREYNFKKSDSIGYIHNSDTLPLSIYGKLLAKSTETGRTIPTDSLQAMQALIGPADEGEVTFEGMCADAGMLRYSAFTYDSINSRPKEIICYQSGDQTACNSSTEARTIARRLNSITGLDLSSMCAPPDFCMHPSTSLFPVRPVCPVIGHPSSAPAFNLSGKKVGTPARQLIVEKSRKVLVDF